LRVIDYLEKHGDGLNLCLEVRDGVVTHCGEEKGGEFWAAEEPHDWDPFKGSLDKREPYTLEGCLVKLCDKIAYVGKDIEDAIEVGLISPEDLPGSCTELLGDTNTEIINTLVLDLIDNFKKDLEDFREEHGRDPGRTEIPIRLSEEVANALDELIFDFNYDNIYMCDVNMEYAEKTSVIIEGLFDAYHEELTELSLSDPKAVDDMELPKGVEQKEITSLSVDEIEKKIEKGPGSEEDLKRLRALKQEIIQQSLEDFNGDKTSILFFLQGMHEKYLKLAKPAEMVRDSITQMTDNMAISIFKSLKIPQPVF
ncbi:MAG: hypothetical protein ACOC55_00755, partial [Candidatus Natronoplasma sp.]